MAEIFFNQGLQFSCTQCNDCCRLEPGYVFLGRKDLDLFCSSFKLSEKEFIDRYCRWVDLGSDLVLCLLEKSNYDCVFWDKGCEVYESRPIQCRTYPFWKKQVSSIQDWQWEARFCPGINKGKLHTKEEILKAVEERESDPPLRRKR